MPEKGIATGIGGVFLRARDPKALYAWYEKHLGLPFAHGCFAFPAEQERAMINFQVDDLEALLAKLTADGVSVDPKRESADYGKFGWITDPEGNRVELWEPPA